MDVAANLLNEEESDIKPRAELNIAGHGAVIRKPTTVLAEVWRPIVVFILGLLALEWWVFVRKS